MKRILISLAILATAAGVFCSLRAATEKLRVEMRAGQDAWQAQTQKVAQISIERTQLESRLEELNQEVAAVKAGDPGRTAGGSIPKPGAKLSSKEREKLLAELGLNWNTTGEYVVVSKETLRNISLAGVKDNQLTAVAGDVLAMTSDERASINASLQRIAAEYQAWAQSHVQSEPPSGNMLAKYTLPIDPEFSQSLSNTFVSAVFDTLGQERGELFKDYSAQWASDLGLLRTGYPQGPTTMTVSYQPGDQNWLGLQLVHDGGTMSTVVSRWQPVPGPFRALFPGGWADVAKQAGFTLPEEFNKN